MVDPDSSAPQAWLDALDRADADLAAGRTVPLADVLAELQASLDRMTDPQPGKAADAVKA